MTPYKQIVLEVTEACHHACLHCYNFWREHRAPVMAPDTLTRVEIRDLIRRIKHDAPLKQAGLSGGEPLLRDDLPGIVEDLRKEGLGVVVITNGTLLTRARAGRFPEDTVFELTLFGADAALHDRIAGVPGAFEKVLEGAIAATESRCRVAVSVVVSGLNAHEVRRALELGIALGSEGFLLNRVNFSRCTAGQAGLLALTVEQFRQMLEAAELVAVEYGASIAVSVPIPPCVVDPLPYEHLHFGWCPRGSSEAYYTVSHNGLLRPCNHSSRILGDLRTHSFAELTSGRAARQFWAPIPAECLACEHPLASVCRGGCPAASDECYGTRLRWDPLINIVNSGVQAASV
ncbi:radical SAM protein [Paludibaculum fermentans]|uniref:radical SAM protein n=1 Tax=Paludibaculum fermentans TaxID=1473598 RepID=UPI003EB739A3